MWQTKHGCMVDSEHSSSLHSPTPTTREETHTRHIFPTPDLLFWTRLASSSTRHSQDLR
jgi:hypothetical protein